MDPETPLLQLLLLSLSNAFLPMTTKRLSNILALPTTEELNACWDLCRLNNHMGCWTTWIPTAWSLAMVYHAQPHIPGIVALLWAAKYLVLCCGIKSLIMAIDDILDHDIDGLVIRTKNRPLPRGSISLDRAWLFFALQVVVGVITAQAVLDPVSYRFAAAAAPLFVIYPTCKRWMYFAPIPLGLMFNVGIFMGWSTLSTSNQMPYDVLIPMYVGACFWVWTYETIYQHMDKADDVKIGIRSSALLCGRYTIPICFTTAVGFFAMLMYGGYLNDHGPAFFVGVGVAAAILMTKLLRTDIDRPEDCKEFFLLTPTIGQVILGGLVVDGVLSRIINEVPL